MPEVIEVRGLDDAQATLRGLGPGMRAAAVQGAASGAAEVLRYMKSSMLSGQRLRVRTGKLRSNWQTTVPAATGPVEVRVSTNTIYAPVHEYGFKGAVQVPSHEREPAGRRTRSGRLIKRKGASVVSVRSHSRQVDLPARWFLRDSVAHRAQAVERIVRHYLERALNA